MVTIYGDFRHYLMTRIISQPWVYNTHKGKTECIKLIYHIIIIVSSAFLFVHLWNKCTREILSERDREAESQKEIKRGKRGKWKLSPIYTPKVNPPHSNPGDVLFQECSCGQCFHLAETCADSARSGPRGDLQFYRNKHKDGQWIKLTCFNSFSLRLVKWNCFLTSLVIWRTDRD